VLTPGAQREQRYSSLAATRRMQRLDELLFPDQADGARNTGHGSSAMY